MEKALSKPKPHPLEDDGSPVGEPRSLFTAAAVRVGLLRPGEPINQNMVDYALEMVTLAARIADH